jgi:NAD(P)-dependent dehydrogenase (short-subunit alcohol dehydrogenase family)
MQAVLPAMKAKGYGRVVNIASLVTSGVPHRTSYAAAKCALVSCTTSWALELAADGITVNAVSPGPTATELFNRNNPPGSDGYKRYTGMVPMGRVAPPEEVAAAVCFFLSEEASFITGQNLYVDGGASVGPAPAK